MPRSPTHEVFKSMVLPHASMSSSRRDAAADYESSSFFLAWSNWIWSSMPFLLLPLILHDFVGAERLWKTLHMDSSELTVSTGDSDCDVIRPIRNDDMSEGDYYSVKSDSWHGKPHTNRRPSECTMAFNLGDRLVSVVVKEWWCGQTNAEPFLAMYDDCEGKRKGLLTLLNCSNPVPLEPIQSSTYCMTLYHYRGHVKAGYFFSLYVVANNEVFAFPAGGIAAIIISIIVFSMLVVKIVCVISGYERRLPEMKLDGDDDQKQILTTPSGDNNRMESERTTTTTMRSEARSSRSIHVDQFHPNFEVTSSASLDDDGRGNHQSHHHDPHHHYDHHDHDHHHHHDEASNYESPSNNQHHNILRYSRSPRSSYSHHSASCFLGGGGGRGGGMEGGGGGDDDLMTPTIDPDYECCLGVSIDDPKSPTLKTNPYTSPMASPLWRH